jgi:hypothetical protein
LKLFGRLLTPGKSIVSKRSIRPNENIILDSQPVPKLHSTFYGDSVADDYIILDKHVVANIAILANYRSRQNMGKSPDLRSRADCTAFTNALWMNEVIHVV